MRERVARHRRRARDDPPPVDPDELAEARELLEWIARRPLHVPRLPRVRHRSPRTARTCSAPCPTPASASCARPTSGRSRQLRAAAAGGAPARAREEPAQPDEGQLARDRAPARLPRLRRRQALRRGRRSGRRAALPRPLHAHRLQREPVGDPGAAAQGAARRRALGPAARQPRPQGAGRDPRDATRATSSSRSSEDELFEIALGILHLGERQRVRLFVRRDAFGRFVSCLVYLPRERFNTTNRARIEEILQRGVRRHERRLLDARLRVGAGAAPLS